MFFPSELRTERNFPPIYFYVMCTIYHYFYSFANFYYVLNKCGIYLRVGNLLKCWVARRRGLHTEYSRRKPQTDKLLHHHDRIYLCYAFRTSIFHPALNLYMCRTQNISVLHAMNKQSKWFSAYSTLNNLRPTICNLGCLF